MAEYALTTATAVPVGNAVPYNATIVPGCGCIKHRSGSGSITLKHGRNCTPAKYHVHFNGNVTGVAGSIQMGLFLDGELINETLMSVVPVAATDVWTLSTDTELIVDCCSKLSCRTITGSATTVNTANIIISREVQKMKYETLKDMICRELEEIERKDELSTSDVDIVYKLIVAKEKIIRAEQIESEMANDTEWQISRQAIPGGSDHNYIIKKGRLYMDDKIEQMMNDPNLTAADRAAIRRSMDLIS